MCVNMIVDPAEVEYTLVSEDGPPHEKCFKMLVKYRDRQFEAKGNLIMRLPEN